MITLIQIIISFIILNMFFLGCKDTHQNTVNKEKWSNTTPVILTIPGNQDKTTICFTLSLNAETYLNTNYGEPPQIAVWLEQPESETIRTIWVTRRMAKGDWVGKVECLTALPYWVSRFNKETKTNDPPTRLKPLPDAITGATPKSKVTIETQVPAGSRWNYFIEVNVSADYNESFPDILENGMPDADGNGQPSLIYNGYIEAVPGNFDAPELIGRTEQWQPVKTLIRDLSAVTSSKKLLTKIQVTCQNSKQR